MSDYRDNFDMHPDMKSYYGRQRAGFVGPLLALGFILVMIAGVFFFSGGTGDVGTSADTAAPAATSRALPGTVPVTD